MYHYDFKNEKFVSEYPNVSCKIEKKYFTISLVKTDKNLLIFFDLDKDNVLKARAVQTLPEYELLFKLPLDSIKYKFENNTSFIEIESNIITCYNFDLNKFLEN